ncbi:MAG: hypoxanthine phosphoribosyltransferase [Tissierellia bacterium]|nr:hypoxanthine phosphoribosyltransferase [Tissierellia bacterium]
MHEAVKEVLVTEEEIREKVKELGERITNDYKGKNLMLVGILKGAVMFLSDLARHIKIPVLIDFMAVSSYGTSSESTGVVRIIKDLETSIEDYDVLIVEDIIDTGLTLSYLTDNLRKRNAKSVKIVTLLDKPERRRVDVPVDYVGFTIPDEFVIGYGIDYAEKYRNLPFVASLKEEVYKK